MGHEYNEKVFFCSHIIHPVCATSSLVEEKEKEKREKRQRKRKQASSVWMTLLLYNISRAVCSWDEIIC